MKYGFIGLGNMAKAIKSGMLNSGAFESKNIYGYDVSENAREAEKENCVVVDSISQVIESSDIIILAIKPQVIESVLNELKGKKQKVI